jgi:hypothetical protein
MAKKRIGCAVKDGDEGLGINRRMMNGKPAVAAVVAKARVLTAE